MTHQAWHGRLERVSFPGVSGDRVQREIAVVALAKQDAERSLALATVAHRRGKPPAKDGHGAFPLAIYRGVAVALAAALALAGLPAECVLDELSRHTASQQRLPDPLGAPLLELAFVLRE